ncbi:MAG: hypothetical protein HW380_3217 [Magnetococcales bacterium]|nr:hypothetical protein [Magnetococcales bacterium]
MIPDICITARPFIWLYTATMRAVVQVFPPSLQDYFRFVNGAVGALFLAVRLILWPNGSLFIGMFDFMIRSPL